MSQQRAQGAKKANGILACVSSSATSRAGAERPSEPALVRPHLSAVFSAGPSLQERHGGPAVCPEKERSCEGLEHRSDGERLRELGWVRVEQRRLRGDITAPCNCLKGGGGEGGDGPHHPE